MSNFTKMRIAFTVAVAAAFTLGLALAWHQLSMASIMVGIVLLSVVAHASALQTEAYKNAKENES